MGKAKPVIAILLAGVLWGCISIFMNGLAGSNMSTIGIAAVRMVMAAIIYVIFMLITAPEKLKIDPKDIWMFLLTGIVSVTFFNFLYSFSKKNIEMFY